MDPDGNTTGLSEVLGGGFPIPGFVFDPEWRSNSDNVMDMLYKGLVELNRMMEPINDKIRDQIDDLLGERVPEDELKAETIEIDIMEEAAFMGFGPGGNGPDNDDNKFKKLAKKYGVPVLVVTFGLEVGDMTLNEIATLYHDYNELSPEEQKAYKNSNEASLKMKVFIYIMEYLE